MINTEGKDKYRREEGKEGAARMKEEEGPLPQGPAPRESVTHPPAGAPGAG